MKRKKGFYSISVVAKMFDVHQQTIRMYEKEGLITPKRSAGNTRMFAEEDVDKLEEIINLTHKMGVNLAGVEIILKLQKKITKLQDDMNKMFKDLSGQLEDQTDSYKADARTTAERLLAIKEENQKQLKAQQPAGNVEVMSSAKRKVYQHNDEEQSQDVGWKVEYDDEP